MRDLIHLHQSLGDLRLWNPEKAGFSSSRTILLPARPRHASDDGDPCSRGSGSDARPIETLTESSFHPFHNVTGSEPMEAAATRGFAVPEQSKALPSIALLTGGADKPYALGLATALSEQCLSLDFIGSDEINGPQLHGNPLIHFFNLRGDQRTNVTSWKKALRVLVYYVRLLRYAASSRAAIFHILWNNKFEHFDRTALMWYYRLLGKRIVFTAHNVNT